MVVNVGDRVVTGSNSRVTITLTDNSKLELDQSTSLVIDKQMVAANSRDTKLSLFSGLVRSLVSHTSGTTQFEVYTPNAVASARGTQFDTQTQSPPPSTMSEEDRKKYQGCRRFTQVSVYEGTVEVINSTNPSGGSVNVPAGNKTLVVCGFAPLSATPITAAAVTTTTTVATTTAAVTSTTTLAVGGSLLVAGAVAAGVAAGSSGTSTASKPISPKH